MLDADETLDIAGLTVLPGLVDEHFHLSVNFGWATYTSATQAAAKGGVTSIIDMPLDAPPTLTAALLRAKLDTIGSECCVDYALYGGYLKEDPDEMAAMATAGAVAFKLFTVEVPVYPGVTAGEAFDAMQRAKREDATVVVHCENGSIAEAETRRVQLEGRTDLAAWDEGRPWFCEVEAVQSIALLAAVTGCRTVIAHATTPLTVECVRDMRRRAPNLWVETCPQYLCISKDEMADPRLKWGPPTRDRAAVDGLWQMLREGHIHTIGSDYALAPRVQTENIWEQGTGVGNSVETMLAVVATEALYERDVPITRIADLLSTTPAKLFGLYPRKGAITIGSDADFAIVETNGRQILDARKLEYHEQEPWSPYDGRELRVYPVYTILRGRVIFGEGVLTAEPGRGEFLTRRSTLPSNTH